MPSALLLKVPDTWMDADRRGERVCDSCCRPLPAKSTKRRKFCCELCRLWNHRYDFVVPRRATKWDATVSTGDDVSSWVSRSLEALKR
jgi:hypothetical protein